MIILVSCVRIQLLNNSHILEVCQPQNNRRPRHHRVYPGEPVPQHPVPRLGGSQVKAGRGSGHTQASCEDGAVRYVETSGPSTIYRMYLDHQIQSNAVLQWVIVGKRCRKSSLTNSATWQSLQINAAFKNTQ